LGTATPGGVPTDLRPAKATPSPLRSLVVARSVGGGHLGAPPQQRTLDSSHAHVPSKSPHDPDLTAHLRAHRGAGRELGRRFLGEAFDLRLRTLVGESRGSNVRLLFAVRTRPLRGPGPWTLVDVANAAGRSYDMVYRDAHQGVLPTLHPQGPGHQWDLVSLADLGHSVRPCYRRLAKSIQPPPTTTQQPHGPMTVSAVPNSHAAKRAALAGASTQPVPSANGVLTEVTRLTAVDHTPIPPVP